MKGREIRISLSRTHSMDGRSSSCHVECNQRLSCPCQLRWATILPGAPDTVEPFHRHFRSDAGIGVDSVAGCVRICCRSIDIRVVCVHGCFPVHLVNTLYWMQEVIYPDFTSDFAAFLVYLVHGITEKPGIRGAGILQCRKLLYSPDRISPIT